MFELENAFYSAHEAEFREKYLDKQLVIAGESLFGVYGTLKEAAEEALKHFKPGEFMIHTPANDGMVIEIGPTISVSYPGNTNKPKPNSVMTISDGNLMAIPYA